MKPERIALVVCDELLLEASNRLFVVTNHAAEYHTNAWTSGSVCTGRDRPRRTARGDALNGGKAVRSHQVSVSTARDFIDSGTVAPMRHVQLGHLERSFDRSAWSLAADLICIKPNR